MDDGSSGPGPGPEEKRGPLLPHVLALMFLWVAGGLIVCCLLFIVPQFSEIFKVLDVALPLPTRLTLALSQAAAAWGFVVLPVAGLLSLLPLVLPVLRRRAWQIYIVTAALALFLALGGMASVTRPIVKIHHGLSKR